MIADVPLLIRLCLTAGFAVVLLALWWALRRAAPTGSAGSFFSVSVNPDWLTSPGAHRIVGQFRRAVGWATLFGLAIDAMGNYSGIVLMVTLPLAVICQTIAAVIAFQVARHRALPRAVPADPRRSVSMSSAEGTCPKSILPVWLPWCILLVFAGVLWLRWNHFPPHYPIRWNSAGAPVEWESRTVLHLLVPLLMGTAQCVTLQLLRWLVDHYSRPTRRSPSGGLQRIRRTMLDTLTGMQIMFTLLFGLIALEPSWKLGRPHMTILIGIVVFDIVGVALMIVIIARRLPNASTAADPTPDRCWWWGLFYVNRDDPAILVPKRFGLGYTMNLGNRMAWAAMLLVLLVSVGGTLVPALLLRLR